MPQPDEWGDTFQPIYAVQDEEQSPDQKPPPQHARRRPRWQWALLALSSPLWVCAAVMLLYVLIPPPPADILVLGLDARTGEGYVTRTDTIILLGVQPRRLRVSALSIPRDLFINVPGYGSRRVNTVNVLGEMAEAGSGPTLLSAGITESFGVTPERYVRLNFEAFTRLVDAVGGVRIDVPRQIIDYSYPTSDYGTRVVRFEPGVQQMDGEAALAYARTRHADDDYGRAARQQQVLSALMRKLANPVHWGPASAVIAQNVDSDMHLLQMGLYAPPMLFSGATGTLDRLVIDREYILGGANGAVPNYEKLRPWIEPRFD